ncbi:MAG: TonB family protein [Azonexus sp.]
MPGSLIRALPVAAGAGLNPDRISVGGLAAVVLVHVGFLVVLTSLQARPAPSSAAVMVHMIAAPSRPEVMPAPRPVVEPRAVSRPTTPLRPPHLATAVDAPTTVAERAAVSDAPPPSQNLAAAATASVAPSVQAPRYDAAYLNNPAPDYPALSRRLGEEGKVVLRVFVAESGRPAQIDIRTSSGSPRLDQAAQAAVGRWQFVAARRGEEAVAAWVLVPLIFNLRG